MKKYKIFSNMISQSIGEYERKTTGASTTHGFLMSAIEVLDAMEVIAKDNFKKADSEHTQRLLDGLPIVDSRMEYLEKEIRKWKFESIEIGIIRYRARTCLNRIERAESENDQ
jgi:hypothetical protein